MSSRRKGHGSVGTTSPISSHMIQKVGINGVTLVPKPTTADKEHPTFALPSSRRPLKHHSPGIVHRTLWNSTFTLTKFISLSHTLIITVFISPMRTTHTDSILNHIKMELWRNSSC